MPTRGLPFAKAFGGIHSFFVSLVPLIFYIDDGGPVIAALSRVVPAGWLEKPLRREFFKK